MLPLFIGVDIAGSKNTWVACLVKDGNRVLLEQPPYLAKLSDIVQLAEERDITAVAIDGQLSISISDENGFRSSDNELRQLLPSNFITWVASFNSLASVPIRARILSENLSPSVATIIETHPRASLYFALTATLDSALRNYKKGPNAAHEVDQLWRAWCLQFGVQGSLGNLTDGALDAAICATVAYLSHYQPEKLLRLRHTAKDKTGRGPFLIVTPELRQNKDT